MKTKEVVLKARQLGVCIPAFNIPHPEMLKPIAAAIKDENSVAMIQVARVEWEKMYSVSLENIAGEYAKYKNDHTLLHLDHIPVVDEDYKDVDYMSLIRRALQAGYESVMIDGSRLSLKDNIRVTAEAAEAAHEAGVPIESELGAVMGHESGEMPPYDEIFAKKMGFTKIEEAIEFAKASHCDWMSVAVGNIHGAIADSLRNQKKPEARLDVDHIAALYKATGIPLVLHGGSGVKRESLLMAIKAGIAKINVGTEMRQCYEKALSEHGNDVEAAREILYLRAREYIREYLENTNLFMLLQKQD